jgi:hypothetical protein
MTVDAPYASRRILPSIVCRAPRPALQSIRCHGTKFARVDRQGRLGLSSAARDCPCAVIIPDREGTGCTPCPNQAELYS